MNHQHNKIDKNKRKRKSMTLLMKYIYQKKQKMSSEIGRKKYNFQLKKLTFVRLQKPISMKKKQKKI